MARNTSPKAAARPVATVHAPATGATPSALEATSGPPQLAKVSAAPGQGLVGQVEQVVSDSARALGSLLPGRFPLYLTGAALLTFGVIELPTVLGAGLAYEALRRWQPTPTPSVCSTRPTAR